VKGLRNVKIGWIGARTPDFRTVRFSEKILERNGISVETVDLSHILVCAEELRDSDPEVLKRTAELDAYCVTRRTSPGKRS
jgi:L-fucose isomerase-like protein